jgi:dephospho-CoA kinase
VLTVGITGGIGSGKSALADLWVARGATLVDADVIAREIVEPGAPALVALVDRFGPHILTPAGELDRQALADVAFSDPEGVAALNEITHPAIGGELAARREMARTGSGICLFAIPLLTPQHREVLDLHRIVVVDCPVEVAVDRLVRFRGLSEVDALNRIASQASREERVALADHVLLNDRDLGALEVAAHQLWSELEAEALRLG